MLSRKILATFLTAGTLIILSGVLTFSLPASSTTYLRDQSIKTTNVNTSYLNALGSVIEVAANLNLSTNNIVNATNVNATKFYQDTNVVCDDSDNCNYISDSEEGNLNVNQSDWWDSYNTASDIATGDLNDDNTFVTVAGDTMGGDLDLGDNNLDDVASIDGGGDNILVNDNIDMSSDTILVDELRASDKIRHYSDDDTYINFAGDEIALVAGNSQVFRADEGGTNTLTIGNAGDGWDIDIVNDLDLNDNDILNWINASGLQQDLVGFWGFESNGQASSPDTSYDSSREANDGTLGAAADGDGAEPSWVAGKSGTALEFDGSDDYVDLPDSNSLNVSKTDVVSYSLWVKPIFPMSTSYGGLIGTFSDSWEGQTYLLIYNNTKLRFGLVNSTGSRFLEVDRNSFFTDNIWQHVTLTIDNRAGKGNWKLYKDGSLFDNGTFTPQPGDLEPSFDALIGETGNLEGYSYRGTIDNVRIYNRSLSEEEVKALYLGLGNGATGHLSLK